MKQIAVYIGTRPEAIKMAPVIRALQQTRDLRPIVISTGQHREMLKQVTALFEIEVHHELDVMQPNQNLASLTARLMTRIDELNQVIEPDMALVQGDTTTVLTAALNCFYRKIPVGHVEAGLRTGDISSPFPEEANRRLTTPLASLHFAPTEMSRQNLLREGVPAERVFVTGNTVIDALLLEVMRQSGPQVRIAIHDRLAQQIGEDWSTVPYVLVTGHRRENFGAGFEQICQALATLADRFYDYRFIYPVHLNPNVKEPVHRLLGHIPNVKLIAPQDYSHFVALMHHSALILTDSGGVQEEAPSLRKPVLVMRENTERPEGVAAGAVQLVGTSAARIVEEVSSLLTDASRYRKMATVANPYGDGTASQQIVDAVRAYFGLKSPAPDPANAPEVTNARPRSRTITAGRSRADGAEGTMFGA